MSLISAGPTFTCQFQDEPTSVLLPNPCNYQSQSKSNARPKNLHLFTGMKSHQLSEALKIKSNSDQQSCQAKDLVQDPFKALTLTKKSSRSKPLLKDLQVKFKQSNISSASTDETFSHALPNIEDDVGESCPSDEINPINEHDVLEAKIHKWLDDEHIYITDPRDRRDQYYQKLKSLSYKISQIQSSILIQHEDEKINGDANETIDSTICMIGLSAPLIPLNPIHDLSMHLKIENSPLLMRRSSNNIKLCHNEQTTPSHCQSVLSASPNSRSIKASIFRSSDNFKNHSKKDISIIPFQEDELEEDEKQDSLSIQELCSISLDIDETSLNCDTSSNSGIQ